MVTISHSVIMDGKGALVSVEGPINGSAAVDLEEYASALMSEGIPSVIIDAHRIDFVSSAGIGALLLMNRKLKSGGGGLCVFALNEETATIFKLLGFDREVLIAGNREEALRMAPRPSAPVRENRGEPAVTPLVMEETADYPGPPPHFEKPVVPKPEEPRSVAFENPIVVECRKCGGLVRVRRSGDYACPECAAEFSVKEDMSLVYL